MGTADLCLLNAKLPHRDHIINANVVVNNGKIVEVRKGPDLPRVDKKIDLRGKLLLPGIVDTHVHFRDPGFTHKEDFGTGSMAAAAGGVTTVCDMPNCDPPTDSLKRFKKKIKIADRKSYVDFGLHAALPSSIREGDRLKSSGAVSFGEVFTYSQGDKIIKKFVNHGLTISVHAEDPRVLIGLKPRNGSVSEFIRCRPKRAETSELERLLKVTKRTHMHVCHVTTRKSVDMITKARQKQTVTCEVTPHHLLLSHVNLRKLGPYAQTLPPLRSTTDARALLNALREGKINIIASDHAPHTVEEKNQGFDNIWNSPSGVVGVETSLPLMLTLVKKRLLSIDTLVNVMCASPAVIFGLRNDLGVSKGIIALGADADFVVVDLKKKWRIRGRYLHGKTKFTPFEGFEATGKPVMTLVRGEKVFEEGKIVGKAGYGRFISRSS